MNKRPVREILHEIVEQEFPGRSNLKEEILRAALAQQSARSSAPQVRPAQPPRRGPRLLLSLSLGLVLLGLVAGSALQLLAPSTVTAAEIIARVEHASTTPASVGLRSYHVLFANELIEGAQPPSLMRTEESWAVFPNKHRFLVHTPEINETIMFIQNGTQGWQYDPATMHGELFEGQELLQFEQATSLQGFIEILQQGQIIEGQTSLIGEETILDRPAYVIDAMLKGPGSTKIRFWIDKEFYFILQSDQSLPGEPDKIYRFRAQSIEFNPELDPALFAPPADVRILPSTIWDDYLDQVPFTLFEPETIPLPEGQQVSPSVEAQLDANPPRMVAYYMRMGPMEERENGEVFAEIQPLFRLTITPASGNAICEERELALGGQPIALGEHQGCAYLDGQRGQTIALTHDGSRIVLNVDEGSSFSKENLAVVAGSLKPVER